MRDTHECAYCNCTLKIVSYEVHGERFCSSRCVYEYEKEIAKYQLSFNLQPAVEEVDACACRSCRDP